MSTSGSAIFMGTSRYSSDFSQVISRALQIASLPLTQMQNQQAQTSDEQKELSAIDTKFAALQTAIQGLTTAAQSGLNSATVSDSSIATASVDSTAIAGTYSLNVISLGAYTTALSGAGLPTVTDPSSTSITNASSLNLTVGGTAYQITPAANTLNALVDAINSKSAQTGVQATLINEGGSGTADYRLSLQSNSLSSSLISLDDGSSIVSAVSNTQVQSSGTVADPSTQNIGSTNTFHLTVNGTAYTLQATSLNALATAISSAGISGISASVVSASGGGYALSITRPDQNTSVTLSQSLADTVVTGSPVQYTINGSSTITSNTRTVSLATGLSAGLLAQGKTDIVVGPDTSGLKSAINTFVSAFNDAGLELQKNQGKNGGALAGSSIISSLSQSLRNIASYADGSAVGSLALMGVGYGADHTGQLSFDSSIFAKQSPSDVLAFLGSATTGFLASATSTINGLEDPISGLIKTSLNDYSSQISSEQKQIDDEQRRIGDLQTSLTNQMARADALIAQMEQQYTYIQGMFTAMNNSNNG